MAKGGSISNDVIFTKTTYAGLPTKFEARTGSLTDAVALVAALNYPNTPDLQAVGLQVSALLAMATDAFSIYPAVPLSANHPKRRSLVF